ncbi:S-adenosyl-L-methionine-dependent methyltransferase [Ramicandelaber brevisporus]|nr:S-adenosyl-L-methionine-dependent methyltransferase [Ramicandelaber brevisporus]
MSFYNLAAELLAELSLKKSSVKTLTLGSSRVAASDKKRMHALVCQTLKLCQVLGLIVERSLLLRLEPKAFATKPSSSSVSGSHVSFCLAMIVVHDLLFTKGGLQLKSGHPLKVAAEKHKSKLVAELVRIKVTKGVQNNSDLEHEKSRLTSKVFRFVRVNLIKSTVDKVIAEFDASSSYQYIDLDKMAFDSDMSAVEKYTAALMETSDAEGKSGRQRKVIRFCRDVHLDDLLVFPPDTDLHDHALLRSGAIILQDKASCFPAHVLFPSRMPSDSGPHVIDGCAAPGNKTTHVAARVGNNAKIWAFDLDAKRLGTLRKMVDRAGADKVVTPRHASFLDADPNSAEFANVEYILLDPSCSGSGIVSRLDSLVDVLAAELQKRADRSSSSSNKSKSSSSLLSRSSSKSSRNADADSSAQNDGDDESAENEVIGGRLDSLADFQVKVIMHAMTFPAIKRISYSTCSVHPTENEQVVARVLELAAEQGLGFELAPRSSVLPTWDGRGIPGSAEASSEWLAAKKRERKWEQEGKANGTSGALKQAAIADTDSNDKAYMLDATHAEGCVRALPDRDAMNGFFVACFVKQGQSDTVAVDKEVEDAALLKRRERNKRKKQQKRQRRKAQQSEAATENIEEEDNDDDDDDNDDDNSDDEIDRRAIKVLKR